MLKSYLNLQQVDYIRSTNANNRSIDRSITDSYPADKCSGPRLVILREIEIERNLKETSRANN